MLTLEMLKDSTPTYIDLFGKIVKVQGVSLDEAERFEGVYATSVCAYDACLQKCNCNTCPLVDDKDLLTCLHQLSVQKCAEIKAYHLWKVNKEPVQVPAYRDGDYLAAMGAIKNWQNKKCTTPSSERKPLYQDNVIRSFYSDNYQKLVEVKAFWAYKSGYPGSYYGDSAYAKEFITKINDVLSNNATFNEFEKYKYIMSILDYLIIACRTKQ